jgi:murein L,D-transpeptidase YcbB/YkuD
MQGKFGGTQNTQILVPQDPPDTDGSGAVTKDKQETKKSGMFPGSSKISFYEPVDPDEDQRSKISANVSEKECSTTDRRFQRQCPDNNITKGCGGQNVKDIQNKLVEKGFKLPRFGADCRFGNETRGAVKNFQAANQLPQTGKVDQDTHNKLFGAANTQESKIAPQLKTLQERNERLEKLVFERLVKGCK